MEEELDPVFVSMTLKLQSFHQFLHRSLLRQGTRLPPMELSHCQHRSQPKLQLRARQLLRNRCHLGTWPARFSSFCTFCQTFSSSGLTKSQMMCVCLNEFDLVYPHCSRSSNEQWHMNTPNLPFLFSLSLSSAGKFVLINTIAVIMSIIIRGARHGSGHNLCQPDGKWGETLEDEFITLTITLDRKFSFANLKEKNQTFFFCWAGQHGRDLVSKGCSTLSNGRANELMW